MEKGGHKRKILNLSVKKEMQFRLIAKVFLVVLVSVVVSATIFYFYSEREIGTSYRLFHIKANNFLDFLLPAVITSFLLSIIIGFIISLFYPHSIAGPLYRVERELLNIGKGDLTIDVVIRKGDEVKDLADNINSMTKELREKIEGIKGASREMKEVLLGVKDEKQRTLKLKEVSQKLEEEVSRFRV